MPTKTILVFFLFIGLIANAQTQINDSASIGANYANQTFYSLAYGTISSIDNSDWDLAFHADKREASIFVNSKKDVKLYLASNDTTKWNSLDTTNRTAKQYHNSDSSWLFGAFNREVTAGGFEYGWGTYNSTTHEIYANKIYFINYGLNLWKKIIISKHDVNYRYVFRYANLDGSNEVTTVITKANYPNRNFIYYNLTTNAILNREPDFGSYDLIFHQYEEEIPSYYKVTGVQLNRNVKAKKVYPVNDVVAATPSGVMLSKNISVIGRDWKAYDVNLSKWSIEDSTVYFVQDVAGAKIWKIVFTGFSGGTTGKMYFTKTAYTSGVNGNSITTLGIYPNPSNTSSTIHFFANQAASVTVRVSDLNGREVIDTKINADNGFNDYTIPTQNLNNGTYLVQLQTIDGLVSQKLIVNR